MYRFFANPDNVGDVLFVVFDPEAIPNRVEEHEGVTALYRDESLVGLNLFGAIGEFGITQKGMIVKICGSLLSKVNQKLASVGLKTLENNPDSGYIVAKVTALEEHPLDERSNIVTLDLGGKTLTTVSRYANLREGLLIVVAIDGCIKFDGMAFHKKIVRNIPIECEVCSPFDLRIGEEGKAAFEVENKLPGEDFFA